MHKLAETLQPLNALIKKDEKWTSSREVAFQCVKDQLAAAPVLCHYDPKLPLRMATDASSYGVGAVLSHVLCQMVLKNQLHMHQDLCRLQKRIMHS